MDRATIKHLAPMASRLIGRALPHDPYDLAALLQELGFRIEPTYTCRTCGREVRNAFDDEHDEGAHDAQYARDLQAARDEGIDHG
ncbi:hypothetical protein [Enterococcus hirae]|uniref:hypothetical protein n=1 Tax=Enterococcus hirae TaxID=1354 RepID=UPI00136C89A5|nr:hypothetical protein [Enterococcus hirae]NAE18273.1 hypothetical protein [Enterococcus hirae]